MAALTPQRVWEALGPGSAPARRSKAVTSDCSAARARRRLAVRSIRRGSRHGSITTAPRPAQRRLSPAALSRAAESRATARISRPGSSPIAASPGACRTPFRSPASSRSHRIGMRADAARNASMSAKPAALPTSTASDAKISCSRPCASPPPSRTSIASSPSVNSRSTRPEAWPSSAAMRRLSVARVRDSRTMFSICSKMALHYETSQAVNRGNRGAQLQRKTSTG